jgi:hypothetical protein
MFQDVYSGWLYARSEQLGDMVVADLTIILPTQTGFSVYADIGLTSLSQGINLDKRGVGTIGTRVARATVMGSTGLEFVDTAVDPASNHAYFEKCLAVEFRLTCQLAEAYARASVWFHAKPAVKTILIIGKTATVVDKVSGMARYSQQYVGPLKKLPSEKEIAHRALEMAAELEGRGKSKFRVHLEDLAAQPERLRGGVGRKKGSSKGTVGRVRL